MNAAELLSELGRLGVRLKADGDRLRFHPRSALTPDLVDRLTVWKPELLAMLRPESSTPNIQRPDTDEPPDWDFGWFDKSQQGTAASRPQCSCHVDQKWWRSVFGEHLICGICHPPASSEIIAEWILD